MTDPTIRCCDDIAIHAHDGQLHHDGRPYAYRHAFEWRRPRVVIYRAAGHRALRIALNRYPGIVTGVAIQLNRRVLSLTWGRPGKTVGL